MQECIEKKHLTEYSIGRAIMIVAVPAVFSFLFQILFELIDTFWLDKLNYEDVFASMGTASFITWSLYALMLFVTAGVNSLVAQKAGAKDKKSYHKIAWEGMFLSVIVSIIITIIMLFSYETIFRLIGLKGKVFDGACAYLRIMIWGYIFIFLYNYTGIIFNSHGDTKTSMIIGFVCLTINIVLDPFLILGLWGLPKLGIEGAAYATVISQLAGFILRYFYLIKNDYLSRVPAKPYITWVNTVLIMKIGVPQAATHWVFSMVYPVLSFYLTKLNNIDALGALSICHRLEGIPYFIAVSLSIAATTLGGQYLGQNDLRKAIKAINRAIIYGSFCLIIASYIFIFHPEALLSFIISAPDIIREGAIYLRIIGYFELFLAWEIIFEGGFTGLGLTLYPMYFSIPLTLSRIPLAYYFAFTLGYGVVGIWWAVSITTLLKGVCIGIIFWSKIWKKKLKYLELN